MNLCLSRITVWWSIFLPFQPKYWALKIPDIQKFLKHLGTYISILLRLSEFLYYISIVTHMSIAKQRFGKHLSAETDSG
jgi:hypothetical protein